MKSEVVTREREREGSRRERQGDARVKEKLLEKISPLSPACLCLYVYVRLRMPFVCALA